MNKSNIIYDNLLYLLQKLTLESNELEGYYSNLDTEDATDNLVAISEEIDTEVKEIKESKENNKLHTKLTKLVSLINTFDTNFSDFPNGRFKEILILIELLSKINESAYEEINLTENLDLNVFSLVKLTKPVYEQNFFYSDLQDLKNSIILLDFSDITKIQEYFVQEPLPLELYLHLMSKIGCQGKPLEDSKYVLVRSDIEEKQSTIWSCLAIHIVMKGKLVHEPYNYTASPTISNLRVATSGKEYQQFNDSIIILSEYNNQTDILNKYLRIYHIIENFMYKYPLVKLEREHNGEVFSIRDFQRMFDKVSSNEITALTNLIKKICQEEYQSGVKFDEFIYNRWTNLYPTVVDDKSKIDSLLKRLRIIRKKDNVELDIDFDYLDRNNIHKLFSQIVYKFRNSIVHNRETEFHLTHETFLNHPEVGNTAKSIIEEFLIPVIEEIIFFLIVKENDIVWFNNSSLTLFHKN